MCFIFYSEEIGIFPPISEMEKMSHIYSQTIIYQRKAQIKVLNPTVVQAIINMKVLGIFKTNFVVKKLVYCSQNN